MPGYFSSPLYKLKEEGWSRILVNWKHVSLSLSVHLSISLFLCVRSWPFEVTLADSFLLPAANHPWNLFTPNRYRWTEWQAQKQEESAGERKRVCIILYHIFFILISSNVSSLSLHLHNSIFTKIMWV